MIGPTIFPLTLLAFPVVYAVTVGLAAVGYRTITVRGVGPGVGSLATVLGAAAPGGVIAAITAPAAVLPITLGFATTVGALWAGVAVRGRTTDSVGRLSPVVPPLAALLGTGLTAGNTATGVLGVVLVAALPVAVLGYHLAGDGSHDRRTTTA